MPRVSAPVYSLNGGEVGEEALSRLDLERMQFASAISSNILPRVVGSMTLRPGLEHIADINLGDVRLLEYSFAGSNASMLVPILSNNEMRILKDNAFVSRVVVATSITNSDFNSFTGWTNASAAGASANVSGGNLVLSGTTQGRAAARQTITVAGGDQGKEHGLRVEVVRGPVWVHIGTSAGASDVLPLSILDDGDHSIAFTPTTGSIYLELYTDKARQALVTRCQIDTPGTVVISTPWTTADLAAPRHKQNIDVLYLASRQFQQREIQRRGDTSWGIQRYKVDDGPFVASDGTVALTPSVYTGNGTLTASRPLFEASMVGRLFRLFQSGQTVQESFTAAPANGASIRVSGVNAARDFSYQVSGTWAGSVRLEVATDDGSGNPGAWSTHSTYTGNTGPTNYRDPDNNVVKFFRFVAVTYTSGTIDTALIYTGGSQVGIARMTAYSSATVASVEVLSRFYSLSPTFEWDFSTWSDYDGWPWGIEAFGGRLYWGKGDFVHGSVPDAFHSFDDNVEGDSAPIYRSIGASTDRGILWLLGLQRLIAGTDNSEISIKSSSFDEPLTASSWFPVDGSTQGSYDLRAVKCDKDGIFVQSTGLKVFALIAEQGTLDYSAMDLMAMHEDICDGSPIVSVAVQRQPDTVVWFILENGEARALTYRPSEKVVAWSRVLTDGQFKQVIACRGKGQDNVYFAVVRNGTQRLERLADLKDCRGGKTNCLADGFKRFTTTASQTTFAVPHLNGKGVTVWLDGVALNDQDNLYPVTGGQVVLPPQPAGKVVVIGLPYVGRWQSTKLAYGAANGTALFKKKRVSQLGVYLVNTMLDGFRVGNDFDSLRRLTTTKSDKPIAANTLFTSLDADMMSISSDWSTDSRLCLEQRSPYPFTAGSLVMDVQTNG